MGNRLVKRRDLRPCRCSSAEKRYELAPPHVLPSIPGCTLPQPADASRRHQELFRHRTLRGSRALRDHRKEHGRLEIRTHSVFHSVDWIASERSYPGVPRFAKLATIAMVESRIERGDKIESERRSYISSRALSAAAFADAVRGHWAIENNLHWTFDVTFNGTSHACEPVTGPRTWRWYATSSSIWCAKPQTNDRSSGAASAPHTIPNTLLQILGALRC
jgi:predicted transposase YbfD/YdcC